MWPLSYLPPAPAQQLRAHPGPGSGRGPRPQPCGLPFPDALRAAAAAAAVSLSLIYGNGVGAAFAASAAQPTEVCRNGGAEMVEEVRAEAVTNEQLVEEAWEVVNESFLPDAASRPWSPEMWMVSLTSCNATGERGVSCVQLRSIETLRTLKPQCSDCLAHCVPCRLWVDFFFTKTQKICVFCWLDGCECGDNKYSNPHMPWFVEP
jgi:hypothetical protein